MGVLRRHIRDMQLLLLAQGSLPQTAAARAWAHLQGCERCRRALLRLSALDQALAEQPLAGLPLHLEVRLHAALDRETVQHTERKLRCLRRPVLAAAALLLLALLASVAYRGFMRPGAGRAGTESPRPRVAGLPPAASPAGAAPSSPASSSPALVAPGDAVAPSRTTRTPAASPRLGPAPQVSASGPAAPSPTATGALVQRVEGTARLVRANSSRSLRERESLHSGDVLRTGAADRLLVKLPDEGLALLSPDSEVKLLAAPAATGEPARLQVRAGRVWAWSPGDGNPIDLSTTAATVRVHGGEVLARLGGPREVTALRERTGLEVYALNGEVAVTTPGHAPARVAEQERLLVGLDGVSRTEAAPLGREVRFATVWGTRHEVWQASVRLSRETVLRQWTAARLPLGLRVSPGEGARGGWVVVATAAGQAAAQAGVCAGDRLLAVAGEEISSLADLAAAELALSGTDSVSFRVRRAAAELELKTPPGALRPLPGGRMSPELLRRIRGGEDAAALAEAQRAVSGVHNAGAWRNLGLAREWQNDQSGALEAYQRAAALTPGDAATLAALGRIYAAVGNPDRAVAALSQALARGARPEQRYFLGRVLLLDDRLETARAQAEALAQSPDREAQAWGELLEGQMAHLAQRDVPAATRHYAAALRLDPGNAEAAYYLAAGQAALGQNEDARALLQAWLPADPYSLRVPVLLGSIAYSEELWSEAERWFRLAAESAPRSSSLVHNNLGEVAFASGRTEEARRQYQSALRLEPRCIPPHLGLGVVLAEMGQWQAAAEQYREALAIDPGCQDASRSLVALLRRHDQAPQAAQVARRYDLGSVPAG